MIELNSSGDLMKDLAASLASENYLAQMFKSARINLSLFGIGLEVEGSVAISNIQVAITKMLEVIRKHGKYVLVCIDEVTPTDEMKVFAGAYQIFIRQDLPISLIMTGLHKNIDNLQNTENLTFLLRAAKILLPPLNITSIAENYRRVLGIPHDESLDMAKLTRGYSFAFQVLGYYTWEDKNKDYSEAIINTRAYLEDSVYAKIWSELSHEDRRFIVAVINSDSGKAEEIKKILNVEHNYYSVYRSRLIKTGIISGSHYGHVKITLPFFDEYVRDNMLS